MPNPPFPHELEEEIRAMWQGPDPDPVFTDDLRDRLLDLANSRRRGSARASRRRTLGRALALGLALLLLGAVIRPAPILAAMTRLLGYIPGIGLVDDSGPLRVLAQPVEVVRGGITVRITDAVLDPARARFLISVEGIPASALETTPTEQLCMDRPTLVLPGGDVLETSELESTGWVRSYIMRVVFPPVPLDSEEALVVLPCLSPGGVPVDWRLPVAFVAAPPDLTLVPVLELTPVGGSPGAQPGGAETGMLLESVIETDDSFILMGTFRQSQDDPGAMVVGMDPWVTIRDASGEPLDYELTTELMLPDEPGVFHWAYRIDKGFRAPLSISLETVYMETPVDASFIFNADADPGEGQGWTLNQPLELRGWNATLTRAARIDGPEGSGYEFFFRSDDRITGIGIDPPTEAWSGYGGGTEGDFSVGFIFASGAPSGDLVFHVRSIESAESGPWTLTWSPP